MNVHTHTHTNTQKYVDDTVPLGQFHGLSLGKAE